MKALLWLLAILALGVAVALAVRSSTGYALFVLPHWRAEISLNLLVALTVVGFVGAYVLVRLAVLTFKLPSRVRAFREHRRGERGRATLLQAIRALFEGRFVRAEKLASEARALSAVPGLADLIAARAAQRLRDFKRRDEWLDHAKQHDGEWRAARLMTVGELLLEERRFDEARTALRELHDSGPRHVATLLLLLRAEQGLGNWEEVLRIAKLLGKHDGMPPEALEGIRVNAHLALLAGESHDLQRLARCWNDVPQTERVQPRTAAAAARAFARLGEDRTARRVIEKALEQNWNGDLAVLYSECSSDEALERLERAETWLREQPRDSDLLLTLGRLCTQRGLWGKAQSYLEASLSARPSQAVHLALADLFDRMGRIDEANRHLRASADMEIARRPDLSARSD
jgi:HemY protein